MKMKTTIKTKEIQMDIKKNINIQYALPLITIASSIMLTGDVLAAEYDFESADGIKSVNNSVMYIIGIMRGDLGKLVSIGIVMAIVVGAYFARSKGKVIIGGVIVLAAYWGAPAIMQNFYTAVGGTGINSVDLNW